MTDPQSSLDRLLELVCFRVSSFFQGYSDDEFNEMDSLKKEIQVNLEAYERLSDAGIDVTVIDYVKDMEQQNKALTEQVKLLNQVEKILINYCGETGENEGLIETLNRKLEQVKEYERYIKELEHKLGIDLQRKGSHYHKDITCPNLEIIKQLQEVIDFIKSEKYTVSRPSKVRIMLESLLCRDFSNVRSQLAELDNIQSERDQLKSKIEKLVEKWKRGQANASMIYELEKEILGENDNGIRI